MPLGCNKQERHTLAYDGDDDEDKDKDKDDDDDENVHETNVCVSL